MIKKPELLAPAGSFEKAKVAFMYGADAVYCGTGELSLRSRSPINEEELAKIINYAHSIGKRVHVTLNTYASDDLYEAMEKQIRLLDKLKVDAIIAADGGVIQLIHDIAPNIEIHISTQANTLSAHTAKFWQKNGASRVILSREMNKEDIKKVIDNIPESLETEMFIHGAICWAYSGRCFLSQYMSGRSANCGDCSQSCRWKYNVYIEEEKKEIEKNLNQIKVLRKSLENDVTDKLKHEKEKIEEARNEAKQILIDAKEEANEIISKLSKMQQSDIKKAEHLRNKLNDSVNNSKAKGLDLSVLLSLNNKAPETLAQSSKTNSKVNIKNNKAQTIKSEINVIGETVAVATEIIDQYLDSCYMAGLKECRIIHGKGTGKLRQGVHEFLKKSRYVDDYYTAGFTDGDIGATIVKLKSKH